MFKKICLVSLLALASSAAFASSDLKCHDSETKIYVKNLSPASITVDGAHGANLPTVLINDSHADCYNTDFDHVKVNVLFHNKFDQIVDGSFNEVICEGYFKNFACYAVSVPQAILDKQSG